MNHPLSFWRDRCAAVAIEFAIILPLLLLIALPIYDYFRYIMIIQKLNKTAATIADMIVISEPPAAGATTTDIQANPFILTLERLENITKTANFLMQPYPFDRPQGQFVSIVSAYDPPDARGPGIYWGYVYNGVWGGPTAACTAANAHVAPCARENQNPTNNPANFEGTFFDSMRDDENVIIVRVCYDYRPLFDWTGTILPVIGIEPPTIPSKEGPSCTTDKLSFVRYYPPRNGPLLQLYNVSGGVYNP